MRSELLQAANVALHSNCRIRIVFKPGREGFDAIFYLLGMVETKLISLPPIQAEQYRRLLTLPAATPENPTDMWNEYWADVHSRTILIRFNEVFVNNRTSYVEYFRDRLYKSVASVEVVG